MNNSPIEKKPIKRGRPAKVSQDGMDTKALLIHSGLVHLTRSGFASTGIDIVLKDVGVPKGSFYHYFKNKEAFGLAVIENYDLFFSNKLDLALLNEALLPLERIEKFVDSAYQGMAKHQFSRGCLVGNLGQEVAALPDSFRKKLQDVFQGWQNKVAQTLALAQSTGDLSSEVNCQALAEYFWIGWEGAVMRAKLMQDGSPLKLYLKIFIAGLPR